MSVMFLKPRKSSKEQYRRSWNNQELADFYRATNILKQAGLDTLTDAGVTDEGDPWFVFLKPDTGDVIAHFARIDGQFIAVSSFSGEVFKGKDIRQIVDAMVDRHPLIIPQNRDGSRLFLHPTAALTAFLAAAFVLNTDGVKATNLVEVALASGSGASFMSSMDAREAQGDQKMDLLKVMLGETHISNNNIAILGAALIVHELSSDISPASEYKFSEERKMAEGKTKKASIIEIPASVISEHQEVLEVDDKSVITNTSSLFAEANSELRQKSNGKPEESEVSLKTKTTNETLSGSLAALKKAEDLSESAIANIRDLQNTLKDGVQNFRKQSTALSDLHHDGDFKHPNVKKRMRI